MKEIIRIIKFHLVFTLILMIPISGFIYLSGATWHQVLRGWWIIAVFVVYVNICILDGRPCDREY